MNISNRIHLEQEYHESEDFLRDENSLIVAVYASGVFDKANTHFMSALGNIHGMRVLDYGCGTGEVTQQLRQRGALVTGFDISETRLVDAKKRLSIDIDNPSANFTVAAAEVLPFVDNSFDAVFGKQILHHLELSIAIPEIVRVLRPGGRAVFLEPLIHNPLLETYRRLTPQLRSPTEKALSMYDLQMIGEHFSKWTHKEFCFLSVLPVLLEALFARKISLTSVRLWLERIDQNLVKKLPFIGRYYWETIMVLEK